MPTPSAAGSPTSGTRSRASRISFRRNRSTCSRNTRCSTNVSFIPVTRSYVEGYKKTINIESQLTLQMATRMILPASLRYQEEVAKSIASLKATGATVPKGQSAHLNEVVQAIDQLQSTTDALSEAIDDHLEGDSLAHAKHARDVIIPAMNAVRTAADQLELLVADDLWPLPTYQEMLFVK